MFAKRIGGLQLDLERLTGTMTGAGHVLVRTNRQQMPFAVGLRIRNKFGALLSNARDRPYNRDIERSLYNRIDDHIPPHESKSMPKIIDHDKYRNELLAKCFDIFADKGYGTLTMRELAAELKVSTGTLYHYWSGKQEIFEAFVVFLGERDRAAFLALAGKPETLEARIKTMLEFVKANEMYFRKQFFIAMDYYRQKGDDLVHNPVLRRSNVLYRESLAKFLGIDEPEIITLVLSFVSGTVLGRMFEGELVSIDRQGQLLIEILKQQMQKIRGVPDNAERTT